MAVGAYDAARDCNRVIPDTLSIVGYDDLSLATLLRPALTTLRTSRYDFGRLSAALLLDVIEGRVRSPQQRVIPPMLIVRESAMPPPATRCMDGSHDRGAIRRVMTNEEPKPGRLKDRIIVSAGTPDLMGRSITDACVAEGAIWLAVDVPSASSAPPSGDAAVADGVLSRALAPHGRADVLVCHLDVNTPLAALTQRASSVIRAAAPWLTMGGRTPAVLLLAPRAGDLGGPDPLARAVMQAGLQQATKTLADEWAARGIRVNALLDLDGTHDLSGPAIFLASEEAAMVSGVTLAKHG
ncbi:MAG: substrate-binding domain-containing protein, partial [Thermomicrobia bacterium]|nr:substrate-binding domain-containing protein [Thermomicrobia bacterium]